MVATKTPLERFNEPGFHPKCPKCGPDCTVSANENIEFKGVVIVPKAPEHQGLWSCLTCGGWFTPEEFGA